MFSNANQTQAGIHTQPAAWGLVDATKRFPGVTALDKVSLSLMSGEIHALVGENGCGKSTLAKIFAGVHQADEGQLLKMGKPITFSNPKEARNSGVATIFQEFSLVASLSVAENIFLGRAPVSARSRMVRWEKMREDSSRILEQIGVPISPTRLVSSLSVAEQQMVEIAKGISMDASLLIMDEPTAALSPKEASLLHDLVQRLARDGTAVLYISHRLAEFLPIADKVTVLRDGKHVATVPAVDVSVKEIVHMMIARDVSKHYPKQANGTDDEVLAVEGLSTSAGIHDVTFTLHKGEVLGLAGMVGSGRTEIALSLFGNYRIQAGKIALYGREYHPRGSHAAISAGVALVPENRKSDGMFFDLNGVENITISDLRSLRIGPFLSHRRERARAATFFKRLRITKSAVSRSPRFVSGGNQQKIVIARWLHAGARLLILDEPTQGIDIGAKYEIYELINELTLNGTAIILVSSDYEELLAMSDSLAIVHDKTILGVVPAAGVSEYQLLHANRETFNDPE